MLAQRPAVLGKELLVDPQQDRLVVRKRAVEVEDDSANGHPRQSVASAHAGDRACLRARRGVLPRGVEPAPGAREGHRVGDGRRARHRRGRLRAGRGGRLAARTRRSGRTSSAPVSFELAYFGLLADGVPARPAVGRLSARPRRRAGARPARRRRLPRPRHVVVAGRQRWRWSSPASCWCAGFGHADARSVAFGLSIAACIAGYTLIDKHGVTHAGPITYLELSMLGPTAVYTAAILRTKGGAAVRAAVGAGDDRRRHRHVRRVRARARGAPARVGGVGLPPCARRAS